MRATRLIAVAAFAALFSLTGCPGGAGVPSAPGAGGSNVDPASCGNYAANDAGRKLKAFFEATVQLNDAVVRAESTVKDACIDMGKELQMAPGALEGQTKVICDAVIAELKNNLQAGIKGEANLKVDYKPAVCKVNIEAAAEATAQCEAQASADVKVRCEGTCSGTCSGECSGKCAGSTAAGGSCNGKCEGTCEGTCSGGCEGSADVQASAQCEAKAEVSANVEAECTEPELNIEYDAKFVVEKAKAEMAINAMKKGLPRILQVQARLKPLGVAVKTWLKAAGEVSEASKDLAASFKDQAFCISGQIAGAAAMMGNIQASFSVSVEVSASASGTIGG
jgi:modification target Cys-rich repeat protein